MDWIDLATKRYVVCQRRKCKILHSEAAACRTGENEIGGGEELNKDVSSHIKPLFSNVLYSSSVCTHKCAIKISSHFGLYALILHISETQLIFCHLIIGVLFHTFYLWGVIFLKCFIHS
jgi:hypothetical protein